jgi:hypothetical protein
MIYLERTKRISAPKHNMKFQGKKINYACTEFQRSSSALRSRPSFRLQEGCLHCEQYLGQTTDGSTE